MKKSKIPSALVRKLGKVPDRELSREFGVSIEIIRRERMLRGLHNFTLNGKVNWTKANVALLGTASDVDIAQRLGVTKTAVFRQRQLRRIEPFGKSRDELEHQWTKKQMAWLGKLTDSEIARRVGINQTTVAMKRRRLNIPAKAATGREPRAWSQKELAILGTRPDTEVAKLLGTHRHQIELMRVMRGIENFTTRESNALWTEEIVGRLGTVPDSVIAAELNIRVGRVASYRQRHQIANKSRVLKQSKPRNVKSIWSLEIIRRLGTVPDSVIALELKITRQAVAQYRTRLAIPSAKS